MERAWGQMSADLVEPLCNLGDLYLEHAQFGEAEQLLLRALKIIQHRELPYPDCPVEGSNLLAEHHQAEGRFDKTEFFYGLVMEVKKKRFEQEHSLW